MAIASGARGLVDRFNRGRPDRQGPQNNQEGDRRRGFLGNDDDDRDPVARRGLLEDALAAVSAPPVRAQDVRRAESPDRGRPARGPEDDPPPLLPGDPNNFGARGRRRRSQDDEDASPVLRRGLLGV